MLTKITDCRQVDPVLTGLLKAGVTTNGVLSRETLEREAEAGTLFMETFPQGLYLLRRRDGFQRLYFMLLRGKAPPDWEPEMCTVTEIPFRPADAALQQLDAEWGRRGFSLHLSRVRLTRKAGGCPEDPGTVCPAGLDQRERVQSLLAGCFSPLTGCLPQPEELAESLRNGEILACPEGILHYNRKGRATELRHLAVAEEHRGKGVGRQLVAAYLARWGAETSRVWTAEDNTAALRLYHSFHYTEDAWRSHVRVYGKG